MKKIMNPTRTETNKRGPARWALAIVCLALMMVGTSAFAAPPANDNFANATTITGADVSQGGTTVDATREGGDPADVAWPTVGNNTRRSPAGDRSVWYQWTAPSSGPFTLKTLGTVAGTSDGLDTQIGVYTGTLGSLSEVASSEDAFDGANDNFLGSGQSQVSFDATSGTQYAIMVNGFQSIAGPFTLTLTSGGGGNTNPPPTGVTLTINVTGGGTTTPAPGTSNRETNDVVEVVAHPTGTNVFLGWTGTDQSDTNLTNTVTMATSKTITAAFSGTGVNPPPTNGGFTSITVLTNGNGRVSPNLNNNDRLKIGKRYRLTARPARDWVFAGWDGAPAGSDIDGAKLSFLMEPGLTITANFAPNPFIDAGVVGTFNGLLLDAGDTNGVSQDCSGEFTIRVNKTGRFSGRITKGGKTSSTSGTFLPDGSATGVKVGRNGSFGILDLHLDMAGQTDEMTGTLTSSNCVANLKGDRQVFTSKNPTPLAGKYTLVFPRDTNTANGNGFASISVSKAGRVSTRGELADGTRFSDNTSLSKNGQAPIYVPLYRRTGSLVGWLTLTDTNASGLFSWIKSEGGKVIPGALETDIETVGSTFNPTNKPFLTLTNGEVEIGGGGIADALFIPVTLDNNTTFTPGGTNGTADLKLKLLPTGLLRGTFVNPTTQKSTALKGIILQNANTAAGYFVTTNGPGYIEVRDGSIITTNEPPISTNEPPVLTAQ